MTPTSIWITGTRDENKRESAATQAWEGTNFVPCQREDATHVSVYLINETESEPVKDFTLFDEMAGPYTDALTLASQLAHEHKVGIKDTYQMNLFRAPAGGGQAEPVPGLKYIRLTGTYDSNPGSHAPFWEPCHRSKATHVSIFYVYATGEQGLLANFLLTSTAGYPEALATAVEATVRLKVPVKDEFNSLNFGPEGMEEKVQVIATAPPEVREGVVAYFARLLGKAKWESVSKAEFDSYQMGSLYETKTEPVCDAATWYAEAMAASNELGYAGMDAASVIRHLGETLTALKEANGQMADKLKLIGSGPDAAYEKVEELKNLLMRAQSHVTAPGLYAAIEEALK